MEDYTKYKLKPVEELTQLLSDADDIFVLACNKCFKEFETVDEPECAEFLQLLADNGKHVTGSANIDFLCNKVQTERKLAGMIPEGTKCVFVISCGLGIQTIADLVHLPVFAASNTLNYNAQHGMALTKKHCGACAQCYLNITGGICPVVDCSKGLLNGQCGGAKDGKCEVDPEKDCAWEKIEQRLAALGRLDELKKQPVQLRDYGKADFEAIHKFVAESRERRFDGYYGGVHPSERKEFTEHLPLERFPAPETVVIPLSQHIGKPATPIVQVGDHVNLGQKIGEQAGFISAPVHASVSGTVVAIEPRLHPVSGTKQDAIVIRSDGKDTVDPSVQPHKGWEELTPDEIIAIVQEAGIVGMGGATFPTYVKLKPGKPIDAVLINGCECEPLLTADHRVMLEEPDDVIYGLLASMKAVAAPKGIIVIEDNKPDAIELMKAKTEGIDSIEIVVARTKYPQGAEKMLIKRVMGRMVPSGGLPADVGALVSNVSTVKAIADAIKTGMPLIERVVSVTGERVKKPGNYIVRVGTPVRALVDHCGGLTADDVTVKVGGAMMGIPIADLDVPVLKGANGVIAYDNDRTEAQPCIKCGRCVDVCPMELEPLYFQKFADENNWIGMKQYNVMDCIECRCCEYICSSKIPLVTKIKAGKTALREMK